MAPVAKLILTSGDLTADRRADYAVMLAESGDHAAAAELLEQALELVPGWVAGWFQLGEYRHKAGLPEASAAYRRSVELAPDDMFGAGLKLSLLNNPTRPDLPSSRFIEGLFDEYADRFDAALVQRLGYTTPVELIAMLRQHLPTPYGTVVDLGCGTGLVGAEIHGQCDILEGYDISENMLAKARAKGHYQHLAKADLSLEPPRSGLFEDRAVHRADIVAATDVMIYLGDLDAVFANAAALLKPSGTFAFSVEKSASDTGFELRPSMRYAHSVDHVDKMLAAHGMRSVAVEETMIRMEAGQPIVGLLFLARSACSLPDL